MDAVPEKPRLRSLLEHFSTIPDARQSWRVAHPLPEVLLLNRVWFESGSSRWVG